MRISRGYRGQDRLVSDVRGIWVATAHSRVVHEKPLPQRRICTTDSICSSLAKTSTTMYVYFILCVGGFSSKTFPKDVTLAALYVSTKMHDTLKKPRDLLIVSYTVRFPELAAKSKSMGGEIDMDPVVSIFFFGGYLIAHRYCRQSNKTGNDF